MSEDNGHVYDEPVGVAGADIQAGERVMIDTSTGRVIPVPVPPEPEVLLVQGVEVWAAPLGSNMRDPGVWVPLGRLTGPTSFGLALTDPGSPVSGFGDVTILAQLRLTHTRDQPPQEDTNV